MLLLMLILAHHLEISHLLLLLLLHLHAVHLIILILQLHLDSAITTVHGRIRLTCSNNSFLHLIRAIMIDIIYELNILDVLKTIVYIILEFSLVTELALIVDVITTSVISLRSQMVINDLHSRASIDLIMHSIIENILVSTSSAAICTSNIRIINSSTLIVIDVLNLQLRRRLLNIH